MQSVHRYCHLVDKANVDEVLFTYLRACRNRLIGLLSISYCRGRPSVARKMLNDLALISQHYNFL